MMSLDILALLMGCAAAVIFIWSELHSKKLRSKSRAALEASVNAEDESGTGYSDDEGGDGHDSQRGGRSDART